jgi:hypothetical protein
MNVLVNSVGGGIFSIFTIAIQQILNDIENVDSIENIYINLDKSRYSYPIGEVLNESGNPFDFVFDQQIIEPNIVLNANIIKTHLNHDNLYNSEELKKIQIICSKIKIKDTVLNKIRDDISEKTLGVHVRLTDMLQHHNKDHGGGSTKEYVEIIDQIIKENEVKNIFVASDNESSLKILSLNFEIINNDSKNINETEYGGNYFKYQLDNLNNEFFWVDSFVDMLSLSKCGILIYKLSNLNNASLFFSKTLTKSYKL